MKIILKSTGEVKEVAMGFATNYLFPKNLAVMATDEAIKQLEVKKLQEQEKVKKESDQNRQFISRFSGKEFNLKAKAGKKGKLHGAITKKDLSKKIGVHKDNLILPEPIKKTGEYLIDLKFGQERAKIKVRIEAEG